MADGVVKFDPVSGYIVDSNTTITSAGLLNCLSFKSAGLSYPTSDSTTGNVLTTNGSGSLSLQPVSPIISGLGGQVLNQTSNVSAGDHVKFSSVYFSCGSLITLNTSSSYTTTTGAASIGRLTLNPGSYLIQCYIDGFSGTSLGISVWDASSNVSIAAGTISSSAGKSVGVTTTYQPSTTKLVEIRITTSVGVSSLTKVFVKVVQI
jgi:hypothetical protein